MRYGSGRQEYGNILELIRKVRYFMFDTNRRTWHRDRCNGIFAVGSKKIGLMQRTVMQESISAFMSAESSNLPLLSLERSFVANF